MCIKTERFEKYITYNFNRVLSLETQKTLGDRKKYIGASDIGDCPYKVVMSKRHPPVHSLKQQIIFQRGHLAEDIVTKMLDGLDVEDQHEVLGQLDQIQLKAHLDKLIKAKNRCVIVEVKTVSAPVNKPYESWVLQVQFQMGLMLEKCDHHVEAYVLAIDLNSGWLKTFHFEFDDFLFETGLGKAQHIEDSMRGLCEPKAIIKNYCGTCPFKMSCPKQGQHANELPHDLKLDLDFIKRSKEMAKEAKLRGNRVKKYLLEMGIKQGKDIDTQTVVSVKSTTSKRLDIDALKIDYPEIYEELSYKSKSDRLTVI